VDEGPFANYPVEELVQLIAGIAYEVAGGIETERRHDQDLSSPMNRDSVLPTVPFEVAENIEAEE